MAADVMKTYNLDALLNKNTEQHEEQLVQTIKKPNLDKN